MRLFVALFAASLLASCAVPARAAGSFEVDQVLALKSFPRMAWSRDGRRLAIVVGAADTVENVNTQHLWMWDEAGGGCRQLTRAGQSDDSPTFSPGGDTLAFVSARATGEDAHPAIQLLPLRGGEPWTLGTPAGSVGEIAWSPDGASIAFTLLDTLSKAVREARKKKWDEVVEDERLQYTHLWVIDVASGRTRQLTTGALNCWSPHWSPDSRSIAVIVNPTGKVDDGNLDDIAVVDVASGVLVKLDALVSGNFAWSPNSRWIAWSGGADRKVFVEKTDAWIARADGHDHRNLTRSFDGDAPDPVWNARGDTLFFHTATGAGTSPACVAIGSGNVTLGADRRADGGAFEHVPPTAAASGRVAWVQSTPTSAPEVMVADHPMLVGRAATSLNSGTSTLALGTTRLVQWTSSDGVRIEGVLLRPAGAGAGGALKTVVLLHGGPYGARYSLGFQPTAQLMASHGFQVFMPNFRSSAGYGTAFLVRHRADWGGQDWRDVSSGIDSLVNWRLADPQRLGCFGGSYGGYLTAWAITQTRRFKAAIVHAGAVDLPALWAQSDTHQYRAYEFEGRPWESFDKWRADSPIAHVQSVTTPTLILNGEADLRIPYPQAQEDYQALAALGVPVEFVHYPREGHAIREPHHRADWLARQVAWFERWVK
ncbi:MAG TPA: S9 family peptidase [Candidatus Acidoferrales bacterium]|nr:S9 family peptidase [Candidatus Acidoferrales bacterium]